MDFRWRADNGTALNAGLVVLWFSRGSGSVLLSIPIALWFCRGSRAPKPTLNPRMPATLTDSSQKTTSFQIFRTTNSNCWLHSNQENRINSVLSVRVVKSLNTNQAHCFVGFKCFVSLSGLRNIKQLFYNGRELIAKQNTILMINFPQRIQRLTRDPSKVLHHNIFRRFVIVTFVSLRKTNVVIKGHFLQQ